MLRFVGELPRKCYVACSGGPDSMAILDFLTKHGKRDVEVLYYHHGTEFGDVGLKTVKQFCNGRGLVLHIGVNDDPKENPNEAYWRDLRYNFFSEFTDRLIVLGHNLDDQVESWIFYSLRGNPKLIPYKKEPNLIRPFILTKKEDLENWCDRKEVPYVIDPSNLDYSFTRSYIRNVLVPNALKVNPGLYKTIFKKLKDKYSDL